MRAYAALHALADQATPVDGGRDTPPVPQETAMGECVIRAYPGLSRLIVAACWAHRPAILLPPPPSSRSSTRSSTRCIPPCPSRPLTGRLTFSIFRLRHDSCCCQPIGSQAAFPQCCASCQASKVLLSRPNPHSGSSQIPPSLPNSDTG